MFRSITLAVSAAAILASPIAAAAQTYDNRDGQEYRDHRDDRDRHDERDHRDDNRDLQQSREQYRDALRSGDPRVIRDEHRDLREAYTDRAQDRADWRRYRNYDYNHYAPGQRAYYADQYYRDGRYYQPRRLGMNDRIYRGRDNRYYCRRSDGTTGLVIGAIGGGVLGNAIAGGGSKTLGTLLGAAGGGLLGRSIDRNNIQCR